MNATFDHFICTFYQDDLCSGLEQSQFFTPFGKAKIKVEIEGTHRPRTQPGAGTELGKDRWGLAVGEEAFLPRVIRLSFTVLHTE